MSSSEISIGAAAWSMAVVLLWSSSTIISTVKAQETCESTLIPCAAFLNSTAKPNSTCCDPLESAIRTQKHCLCTIYNDTALLKAFHINLTRALQLPKDCGFPSSETNICNSSSASNTSPPPPPPPGNSAVGRAAWSGYSGLVLLCLWVASLMLCQET